MAPSSPRTRPAPGRTRGRSLILALALTLVGFVPAHAQTEQPPEGSRKWIFGVGGAVLVGVPAYLAEDFGVGSCSSSNCFAPIAAAVGGIVGFMLGAELDKSAARKWVAGPKVDLSGVPYDVPLVVDYMTPITDGVALLGEAGLARANPVVGVTATYAARGLLAAVVAAEHEALLATSASAILSFDQNASTRGARRAFGEGGAALAGDGGSRLVLGGEGTLRLLDLSGKGIDVTMIEAVSATEPVPARALVWSSADVIWEVAESRLVARSTETLAELGTAALPGPARALSVDGTLGVAAGGESGVSVLDLSDPARPVVSAVYEGVRYAFDAELSGTRVYIAAGEQGLVILDLGAPETPVVAGVVGNLGLPYAVVRSGSSLYVLDRDNAELHVIPTPGGTTTPEH